MDPLLPIRRSLPHWHPPWVRENAIYFITVCCEVRRANQLCHPEIAATIFESIAFRQNRRDGFVHLALLMPDHLHALVTFPGDREMCQVIEVWKGLVAKRAEISWQRGFFEHRIRSREEVEAKAFYIRRNPIRAGLADDTTAWPYVWEAEHRSR